MGASSVLIAKDRLKALLLSDRMNCTPDILEKMEVDLYRTISKYVSVEADKFHVCMTRNHIYITLTGENT